MTATGLVKLSVHSWLLQIDKQKILIDACGNQNQTVAAVLEHAQHALSGSAHCAAHVV
jgi:hypothetical protein